MTITDQGHFNGIFIEKRNAAATDSCDPLRLATCNPARHDGRQFWRATVPCRRPFRSGSANVAAGSSLSWVAVERAEPFGDSQWSMGSVATMLLLEPIWMVVVSR
jgi:hypothetical protein